MITYFICVLILALLLLFLNILFTQKQSYLEKLSPFECGINPTYGQTKNFFTIKYYLVALLFLIFDLEISLLYPIATIMNTISFYSLFIAIIFYLILTIGFIIEFKSGALYFNKT